MTEKKIYFCFTFKLLITFICLFFISCVTHVHETPVVSNAEVITDYENMNNITYYRRDTTDLKGDLYLPKGKGPFPAVLLIHGGSWSGGKREYNNFIARKLAKRGYAVFNISYSFVPKYIFPTSIEDCEKALKFLKEKALEYNIDSKRLAVWGYSAGAHMAALVGTRSASNGRSDIKAVVAGSGPYDFTFAVDSQPIIDFLGTTYQNNQELYHTASPVFQVNKNTPPMFLYHGTWDTTVSPEHTKRMQAALEKKKIPHEVYLVNGVGHITLFVFGFGAEKNAIHFLDRHMKIEN